jgi:hypothetical protein
MSVSCFGLREIFEREHAGLRNAHRVPLRTGACDLEQLLREGQNRFKAPHKRDYGYRLPVPFCWGPNGSAILLALLLAPAIAVTIALMLVRGMS